MFNRRGIYFKHWGLTTTGIAGFGWKYFAAESGKQVISPLVFSPIRHQRKSKTTGGTGLHRVVISGCNSVTPQTPRRVLNSIQALIEILSFVFRTAGLRV